jgi:hypothetical protein
MQAGALAQLDVHHYDFYLPDISNDISTLESNNHEHELSDSRWSGGRGRGLPGGTADSAGGSLVLHVA